MGRRGGRVSGRPGLGRSTISRAVFGCWQGVVGEMPQGLAMEGGQGAGGTGKAHLLSTFFKAECNTARNHGAEPSMSPAVSHGTSATTAPMAQDSVLQKGTVSTCVAGARSPQIWSKWGTDLSHPTFMQDNTRQAQSADCLPSISIASC